MNQEKFYITTAIPYVNAPPHIGHALEFVQTDVIARYHRLRGEETFLTTGADENAQKNVQAAVKAGIPTQEFVDKNANLLKLLAKKVNMVYDGFDKGSDKKTHWPGVIELWKRCQASGDIYKKKYKGLYCVGHEAFVTEKDLVDGKCPDHETVPDEVEEENYFFKLSKYQKELERIINSDEYQIIPETRKNEVLSFIRKGLKDFSVSREKERSKGWGIPVPGDESQVIYVWFDALGIYLTAVGFGTDEERFKKWWPADVHVIGKDIIRFHAVYWPAILLSARLPLPKKLLVHGFIVSGGQKMSKTRGNVVDPFELVEKYGSEALRYYLMAEIPTTEDGDFTEEKFIARYNGDLADGIGNLTARILTLAEEVDFSKSSLSPDGIAEAPRFKKVWNRYGVAFKKYDLRAAIGEVLSLVHWLDGYIEQNQPWASSNEVQNKEVIYTLLVGLANISWLLKPFLPKTAEKIAASLGIAGKKEWKFSAKKIEPLFPKI